MSVAATEVDPSLWQAIAGSSVQIPHLNSYVYYFPQGHFENLTISHDCDNDISSDRTPFFLCKLLSIRFLADPSSDQIFAVMRLQPSNPSWPCRKTIGNATSTDRNDVLSYAKVLTPSDAKNEGGISIPRYCADLIFPRLDLSVEPPRYQNLVMKDAFEFAWEFRHVYSRTPRRHLLTTGWNRFVSCKQLVAGDTVVFMRRKSTNELFIGIRRGAVPSELKADSWKLPMVAAEEEIPFEVAYYPRLGMPNFVVCADRADESVQISWPPNSRVKMAVESEDYSRVHWLHGTVTAVNLRNNRCTGFASPWRMLQVTWDESEVRQNVSKVSPWEVEYIVPNSNLYPSKKLKAQCKSSCVQTAQDKEYHSHLNESSSMQGARLSEQNDSSRQGCDSTTKVVKSFQLFGKTIQIADPVEPP